MQIFKWIFLTQFLPSLLNAGTVAGNGGDPLLHFLEATRSRLVETAKDIALDPSLSREFCGQEDNLSTAQREFCREYFLKILKEVLGLNKVGASVPFVLRLEPLLVTGPDGVPMPVAGRTTLGPDGPIEFHLDSIKLMAPKNLLHLMAHEFQHKSNFEGHYLTDNEPIGPFQFGRHLIDAVSSALVKVATKRGRLSSEFTLRDSFECSITTGTAQNVMRASTKRWFLDLSLVNYQLSLGEKPLDPLFYAVESSAANIVLQLHVSDSNHCNQADKDSRRWTSVSLWRVFNSPKIEAVQLTRQIYDGLNPLCEKSKSSFIANYQNFHFDCRYYGTAAE